MNARTCGLIAVACILPATAIAQQLPSSNRKPALTRKENWGASLGFDVISVQFQPTRCGTVTDLPSGTRVFSPAGPCNGEPVAYPSTGFGVGLNAGVMFLRHLLLGGEVWAVAFRGERTFPEPTGSSGDAGITTNSIAASAYIGAITSPIGGSARQGRKFWFGALAGKSHWSGQRSCTNCRFMPMKMGRPAFVEPFVVLGGGDKDGGGGLRLAYRHHYGGFEAMHSSVTFGLFFALGRL